MIRFLTAILPMGRCIICFPGLEHFGLGYYIEVDTEEDILMYRFEAHDKGCDSLSGGHFADRTVYYRHC